MRIVGVGRVDALPARRQSVHTPQGTPPGAPPGPCGRSAGAPAGRPHGPPPLCATFSPHSGNHTWANSPEGWDAFARREEQPRTRAAVPQDVKGVGGGGRGRGGRRPALLAKRGRAAPGTGCGHRGLGVPNGNRGCTRVGGKSRNHQNGISDAILPLGEGVCLARETQKRCVLCPKRPLTFSKVCILSCIPFTNFTYIYINIQIHEHGWTSGEQ